MPRDIPLALFRDAPEHALHGPVVVTDYPAQIGTYACARGRPALSPSSSTRHTVTGVMRGTTSCRETVPVTMRPSRRPCRRGPASFVSTSQLGVSGCGVRRPRLVLRTLAQQVEQLLGVEFAGLRRTQEVPQDLDEADGLLHLGVVAHTLHHLQPAVGDGLVR